MLLKCPKPRKSGRIIIRKIFVILQLLSIGINRKSRWFNPKINKFACFFDFTKKIRIKFGGLTMWIFRKMRQKIQNYVWFAKNGKRMRRNAEKSGIIRGIFVDFVLRKKTLNYFRQKKQAKTAKNPVILSKNQSISMLTKNFRIKFSVISSESCVFFRYNDKFEKSALKKRIIYKPGRL